MQSIDHHFTMMLPLEVQPVMDTLVSLFVCLFVCLFVLQYLVCLCLVMFNQQKRALRAFVLYLIFCYLTLTIILASIFSSAKQKQLWHHHLLQEEMRLQATIEG
jgi:hypothetical protein